jgi:hypothetical protein
MQSSEEATTAQVGQGVKYVIKRNGTRQPLNLEKIRARFVNKGAGLNDKFINYDIIVQKVAEGIYQGKLLSHSLNQPRYYRCEAHMILQNDDHLKGTSKGTNS